MAKRKATRADEDVSLEVQEAEAARLKTLWDAVQPMAQSTFGQQFDLGSQGNVGHYLFGRQPLNLRAAMAFATVLKCPIDEFSPRLAEDYRRMLVDDPLLLLMGRLRRLPEEFRNQALGFMLYQFHRASQEGFGDPDTDREYADLVARLKSAAHQGASPDEDGDAVGPPSAPLVRTEDGVAAPALKLLKRETKGRKKR